MNPTIDLTVELRHAVDELTLPSYTKVNQDIDGVERVTRVEHAPLLTQLEEAITAVLTKGSGGGAEKGARNVIDSDALHAFMTIQSQIADWCRMAGLTRPRHPLNGLRAWHAWTLGQDINTGFHVSQLRGWASTIRGKLEPKATLELTAPCPECDATAWLDEEGNGGSNPVRVEYRVNDLDILSTARAYCLACGVEWRGAHALRGLRWDVDTKPTDEES